jgi:hypothetical protein
VSADGVMNFVTVSSTNSPARRKSANCLGGKKEGRDDMKYMNGLQSIAPAHFLIPEDSRTVVIEQSHRRELTNGVKDYWIRVTVQPEGEDISIAVSAKEGRPEALSYLTLTIEETRKLSRYLLEATQVAEEYLKDISNDKYAQQKTNPEKTAS